MGARMNEAVKDASASIVQLGQFTIQAFGEGLVWISTESGEGGAFSAEVLGNALVKAVEQLYAEKF